MILAGVVASSAGGFVATGGNITFDANGFRHHYFSSSGTLNVSGPGAIKVIAQHGGESGGSWRAPNSDEGLSGAGGLSGLTDYYDGTVSGNIAVVVGGAASPSAAGVNTQSNFTRVPRRAGGTPWRVAKAGSFCVSVCCDNWGCYCCWFGFTWSLNQSATAGTAGPQHSAISTVYSGAFQQYSFTTNAAGGGGAGGLEFLNTNQSWQQAWSTSGGADGGGQGGDYSNGQSGGANSGGGGGGAQAYANSNGISGTNPGLGGSGYVIISYPI
jgi:hypothetical protein